VKNVECVDLVKSFPMSSWSRKSASRWWKLLIPRKFCWLFVLLRTVAYVFHLFWAPFTDWYCRTDPSGLLTCASSLLSSEDTSAQSLCQARVVTAAPAWASPQAAFLCWLLCASFFFCRSLLPDGTLKWSHISTNYVCSLLDIPNIEFCWEFLQKVSRFPEFLRIRLSWHQ